MGKREDKKNKRHLAATYSPTDTLRSTIGAGGLNYRVRHGAGCTPSAITTRYLYLISLCYYSFFNFSHASVAVDAYINSYIYFCHLDRTIKERIPRIIKKG